MKNRQQIAGFLFLLGSMIFSPSVGMAQAIHVRIIALDQPFKGGGAAVWAAKGHTAQDILRMVGELRPTHLDRFVTGAQNPTRQVPVKAGSPPMTVLQFLNACQRAGGGSQIVPKVHLNHTWPQPYRDSALKNLRGLQVNPRIVSLSMDGYFSDKNPGANQRNRGRLQSYKKMGFSNLGFNFSGGVKRTYGTGSFGYVIADKQWNPAFLNFLSQEKIKNRLLHFDYPPQIKRFSQLSPDKQAQIITKLSDGQKKRGYRFVYPVLYAGYDSTRQVTSKNGPYKGVTVYEVIRRLIERDRRMK